MKKNILKSFIILIVVVLSSCSEEQMENKTSFRFKAVSSNLNLKSASQTGTIISIQTAMIGISEVELEMEYEEGYESENGETEYEYEYEVEYEIEFRGPYTVDLIKATSTPEIAISNIEQGMYSEFECEISNVMDNGKSMYIEGEIDLDGTIYMFVFETEESFEIEIEGLEHFNQPINGNELLTIGFDLDYLLFGLNFENVEIDENDKIIISNTSNTSLYGQIKNRIENSFDFEDDDHQGDQNNDY